MIDLINIGKYYKYAHFKRNFAQFFKIFLCMNHSFAENTINDLVKSTTNSINNFPKCTHNIINNLSLYIESLLKSTNTKINYKYIYKS